MLVNGEQNSEDSVVATVYSLTKTNKPSDSYNPHGPVDVHYIPTHVLKSFTRLASSCLFLWNGGLFF